MFEQLLVLDIAAGAIRRIDVATGAISTVVADTGRGPDGLVQDPTTGRIYWTLMGRARRVPGSGTSRDESAADYTDRNGGLRSAEADGSDVVTVIADGGITTGKQLAIDGGFLYWSDREGGRVSRSRLDGSELTDLVVTKRDPASGLVDIGDQCVGVAVDSAAGHVFWTQKGPSKGDAGRIFRAGIDIPDGETADARTDIETLWAGLPEPIDLWLDAAADTLFWTDRGAAPRGNTLNSAQVPAPGFTGATPHILADGFGEAIGLAVDVDAGIAYVTALDGTVRAVPTRADAPAERVVATVPGSAFTGIVGVRS